MLGALHTAICCTVHEQSLELHSLVATNECGTGQYTRDAALLITHLENLPSVAAVDVALIDVNFAMRSRTLRFWTTNSRVGHIHSACGRSYAECRHT